MKHLGGHHNRLLDEVGGGRHGSRGRELGGFIRAVGADVGGCSRRPLLRLELRKEKKKEHARTVIWTSLGPLPRWVPGPTTRWAPGTT
jgi:hypothetical protein